MADPDLLDELTVEHRAVLDVLDRLAAATEHREHREHGDRGELRDRASSELVRHAAAEEMYVYPALERYLPDGRQIVDHNLKEHKRLEQLLKKLAATPVSAPRFAEVAGELAALVREHAQREEAEQFPRLRAAAPESLLVELREKVASARRRAPTRPHPGAPRGELFRRLAGPGVGLLDRIRDRLPGRH